MELNADIVVNQPNLDRRANADLLFQKEQTFLLGMLRSWQNRPLTRENCLVIAVSKSESREDGIAKARQISLNLMVAGAPAIYTRR